MKRNVVPLLAIAFVVAAISTGAFYGLFAGRLRGESIDLPQRSLVVAAHNLERGTVLKPEDLKVSEIRLKTPLKGSFESPQRLVGATVVEALQENEPINEKQVALKDQASSNGVPSNMRAVSIHVYESSGIISLIRRGSRVDIQAVAERNHEVALSTVLQNIEVIAVNTQPETVSNTRNTAPVVTVLTGPTDSDVLALADSGTHLRLVLRNPMDDRTEPRKSLAVPALFQNEFGKSPSSPLRATSVSGSGQGR